MRTPAPALKAHDSVVAVFFAGRVAERLVPGAVRLGLSPNAITAISFAINAAGAAMLLAGGALAGIAAALLIAAGFVADCLDGQVARVTGRSSDFGAYFDAMTDLLKVFLILIAMGIGSGDGALLLAAWSFLWFALCQHHVHVVRPFPQRPQREYESEVVPWKERLVFGGQRIDLAFAIGEVIGAVALGAALGLRFETLAFLAVILPLQFASYAVRFWRHRYRA